MYVSGFVLAVKSDRKDAYLEVARTVGKVFREYGATRVVECWGDEVPEGKITSFPMSVKCEPGETVVFSWLEFPDKDTHDACMKAIESDPRMKPPESSDISDPARMIFGGFSVILDI